MGKQTIKRDALRFARQNSRKIRSGDIPAVSIAQELKTGKILAVGVDHGHAAEVLRALGVLDDGSWELKQFPVHA